MMNNARPLRHFFATLIPSRPCGVWGAISIHCLSTFMPLPPFGSLEYWGSTSPHRTSILTSEQMVWNFGLINVSSIFPWKPAVMFWTIKKREIGMFYSWIGGHLSHQWGIDTSNWCILGCLFEVILRSWHPICWIFIGWHFQTCQASLVMNKTARIATFSKTWVTLNTLWEHIWIYVDICNNQDSHVVVLTLENIKKELHILHVIHSHLTSRSTAWHWWSALVTAAQDIHLRFQLRSHKSLNHIAVFLKWRLPS